MSEAHTGHVWQKEVIEKRAAGTRKHYEDHPKERLRVSKQMTGRVFSKQHRQRLSKKRLSSIKDMSFYLFGSRIFCPLLIKLYQNV